MRLRISGFEFITRSMEMNAGQAAIAALRSDMKSGLVIWESAVGLANQLLLTPTLWVSLRDKGLVDYLPSDLFAYLRELHHLNTERNRNLKMQAMEAIRALNAEGIEPVLLKGGVFLFDNTLSDLGARIMVDLDILVSQHDLDTCWKVLQGLGYRPTESPSADYSTHHHCVPLIRRGDYGSIEVHRDIVRKGAAHIFPTEIALANTEHLRMEDLSFRILTPTCRVLHSILHSEVFYPGERDLMGRLRSLNDLVVISSAYQDQIGWVVVRKQMKAHGKEDMLQAYLYLAHRILGMALPSWVQPTAARMTRYAKTRAELRFEWFGRVNRRIERTIGALHA